MKNVKKFSETRSVKGSLPLAAVILTIISSAVYFISKRNKRLYIEKWQDYDECGI